MTNNQHIGLWIVGGVIGLALVSDTVQQILAMTIGWLIALGFIGYIGYDFYINLSVRHQQWKYFKRRNAEHERNEGVSVVYADPNAPGEPPAPYR